MPIRKFDISALPTDDLHDILDLSILELMDRKEEILYGLGSVAAEAITKELVKGALYPASTMPPTELADGRLTVIHQERRIEIDGNAVHMPPTPYRVLAYLASQADKAVSSDTILKGVWGDAEMPSQLKLNVSYARSIIGKEDLGNNKNGVIRSIRGVGYAAVTSLDSSLGLRAS